MLRIRSLALNPPLLLAPMAGITHSAFRSLLLRLGGVGLLSTEMLSARRLPVENAVISPFLVSSPGEHPLSYQLLVADPARLGPAIERVHQLGGDAIDLNLGCPAPQVRRIGGGSSLVEDHDALRRLVAEARRCTELPLTAKIRLGEELDETRLKELCLLLEGEGIDLLTVHARLRREPFIRKPRWEWVGKVKSWLSIPVIANGGIFSVDDARRCLELSRADGLMLGRGAVIRPWLFAELAARLYGKGESCPVVDRSFCYFFFLEQLEDRFAPERRLGRLKEFTHYFSKTYPFGLQLASSVQGSRTMEQARREATLFFEQNRQEPFIEP